MQQHEFNNVAELEEIQNSLARASRHPVHVDLGDTYEEGAAADLSQTTLHGSHSGAQMEVEQRLDRVEVMDDLHVVWNNRDDRRAYLGSDRYNLIQHREVIDALREAVGNTTGSIEKGVVRDHGEHVNGVLVFGDQDEAIIDVADIVDVDENAGMWSDGYVPPEGADWTRDRLGLGARFHNSFNGRSGFGGSTMAYRFICQNWMVWGEETIAEKSSYHIKGGDEAPGVTAEYFEDVIAEVFEQRDPLIGVVKDAVEEGEVPQEWVPGILDEHGFGTNYAKRITARLLEQHHPREDHTTIWNVYNAATGHLDNDRAHDLGPERYDHHQENAWSIVESEPEAPDEVVEDLDAYVAGVTR